MIFVSVKYFLFLGLSVLIYYLLPRRGPVRNFFLLIANYFFYIQAIPAYAAFIIFSTLLSYFSAILIEKTENQKTRKILLAAAIFLNLAPLLLFKYYNFIGAAVSSLLPAVFSPITWAAPLGISFYTFQSTGYIIDVSRKAVPSERNIICYALFVSFFPQILSGPIGRAKELLPQFKEQHKIEYLNIQSGFQRFLFGLFKKVVIADLLGLFVDYVYADPHNAAGFVSLAAVIAYALQIYCDFSGYSDMAVGSAKMFGFSLVDNFAAPYYATNMSGFWKRWHISLTSWFSDYIFVPLVWSRWWNKIFFGKKADEHPPHFYMNLIIIFVISGLWHGASICFIVWGLLHGIFRCLEEVAHKIKKPSKSKNKTVSFLINIPKRFMVFILSAFAHIFFRASSVSDAFEVIKNLFGFGNGYGTLYELKTSVYAVFNSITAGGDRFVNYILLALLASFVMVALLDIVIYNAPKGRLQPCNPLMHIKFFPRWICYFAMISAILTVGWFGSSNFVYFQF